MATVASLVRGSDGYMNFIDYQSTYKDNNKEFLRGDMWEFTLINPPKIVYYPGDQIFKARLNQVNLGLDTSVSGFEKRMRGNYVIFQRTGQSTSGQITLQFTDREDQAISYFVDDWKTSLTVTPDLMRMVAQKMAQFFYLCLLNRLLEQIIF